jgi:peptide/histidine transporter 3/4
MAFYGIASNLVVYLTTKLHEGTVESSNNISNLGGAVWMMPLAGAYIADAYLGRYWTFVIASIIYFMVRNMKLLSSFKYMLFSGK